MLRTMGRATVSSSTLPVVLWVHVGVVQVRGNHQKVGNTKPHGKKDHLRKQSSPEGTNEVEQVTKKPDTDKADSNTFGRLHSPLLNQLRHEQDYPTGEAINVSRDAENVNVLVHTKWSP